MLFVALLAVVLLPDGISTTSVCSSCSACGIEFWTTESLEVDGSDGAIAGASLLLPLSTVTVKVFLGRAVTGLRSRPCPQPRPRVDGSPAVSFVDVICDWVLLAPAVTPPSIAAMRFRPRQRCTMMENNQQNQTMHKFTHFFLHFAFLLKSSNFNPHPEHQCYSQGV